MYKKTLTVNSGFYIILISYCELYKIICKQLVLMLWRADLIKGEMATFGQQTAAKTKTITIEKGKTYQLKLKKGSKIICKNKKISKVTKTGKIKALKKGKCTIKVKKGKNIKKYIIHVKENDNIIPTPTPISTPIPSPAPTASPNRVACPNRASYRRRLCICELSVS